MNKYQNLLITLAVACLVASLPLAALTPKPANTVSQKIALVGGTIHTVSNGDIENGVLTFADGKITGIHKTLSVDLSDYQKIDISGQHVYPSLILPDSVLGLVEVDALRHTRDFQERGAMNPSVRTLTSYNTDSELIPTMRFNGILIAQVAPFGGLVSGTSSIVQLDAWNWEDATIKSDDGVHITWPNPSYYKYDSDTDTVNLTENESYQEDRQALEALFTDSAADRSKSNLKLQAMHGLFDGSQTLYLSADRPQAIIEGIGFLKQVGVKRVVLKSNSAVLLATDILQQHNVPVLLNSLHNVPTQDHHDIDTVYRLPQELLARGIKVGISNSDWLMSSRNLAFHAGSAAAYGMPKNEALRMITLSNAEILGIDNRLGSLEVGKDATLFVSSGDALDMRSQQLSHIWIDGRPVELNAMQQELHQRFKDRYSGQ